MHTVHAVRSAAYAFRLCPVCRAAFRAACGGIGAAASGGGLCAAFLWYGHQAAARFAAAACACGTAQNKESTHKRRGGVLCAACGLWRRLCVSPVACGIGGGIIGGGLCAAFLCGLCAAFLISGTAAASVRNGGGLYACVPFPFCGLCCVPFRNGGGGLCACAFGVSPLAAASVRPVHFARRRHGQRNGGGVPLFRINFQILIGVPLVWASGGGLCLCLCLCVLCRAFGGLFGCGACCLCRAFCGIGGGLCACGLCLCGGGCLCAAFQIF